MIPQQVIETILDRVSIVDVIGRHTEVKRNGRSTMALCPFHNEKSPSFSISEEKGLYHCFGCGASGNAVRFLMEYKKLTFPEAIRELAEMAHIDLSEYEKSADDPEARRRDQLLAALRDARDFYHDSLLNSPQAETARSYFKSRGLSPETVRAFKLGYGGAAWEGLYRHLRQKGHAEDVMEAAGLVIRGKPGARSPYFDRFRARALFPISDREGRCVGFGGRVLEQNAQGAKYLNSPEGPLYHKSGLLYALNMAKEAVSKAREALVVEGYMDVIAMHQAGFINTVAPLGTALTAGQLGILRRFAETVVFLFDGDAAGIKAANRALDEAVGTDLAQFVVILPSGLDPDDYIRKNGRDAMARYISEKRLDPMDFKLRFFSRQPGGSDRVRFLAGIFPYLSRVKSAVLRDEYLKRTARFLKQDYGVVLEEYQQFVRGGQRPKPVRTDSRTARVRQEIEFAGLLCNYPGYAPQAAGIIEPEMISDSSVRKLFEFAAAHSDKSAKEIFAAVDDQDIVSAASRLAQDEKAVPALLTEVALKLRHTYILKRMDAVSRKLAVPGILPEDRNALLTEQSVLSAQKEEIQDQIRNLDRSV